MRVSLVGTNEREFFFYIAVAGLVAIGTVFGYMVKNIWELIKQRNEKVEENQKDQETTIEELKEEIKDLEILLVETRTELKVFLAEIKDLFRLREDFGKMFRRVDRIEEKVFPD